MTSSSRGWRVPAPRERGPRRCRERRRRRQHVLGAMVDQVMAIVWGTAARSWSSTSRASSPRPPKALLGARRGVWVVVDRRGPEAARCLFGGRLPVAARRSPPVSTGPGVGGGDAEQVVDRGGDLEPGPVALLASVAKVAAADGLDPPEGFLDPFPDSHTAPGVAGMSGGAALYHGPTADRCCMPQPQRVPEGRHAPGCQQLLPVCASVE